MTNKKIEGLPQDKWLVECKKCGYVWLAKTEHPKRCSACNNPNPEEPKKYRG